MFVSYKLLVTGDVFSLFRNENLNDAWPRDDLLFAAV